MKIVELPPHWRDRAMIISAVADPESWFSAEEIAPLTRPKRRREWMLSRIAEKELRQRGASGGCVSFSHSGSYGAAAVSAQPIGIDVETLREISESAAHHFLSDEEIESMLLCTIAHRMLHFWSAKEAAWKRLGGSMPTLKKVPLRLEDQTPNGLRFDGVETFAVNDLVAALTLPTS
ncbi:MAG TPA: 4'-phosphopantetheinyl transferase superfamily protein [Thermoanaerobaculia bacterium]|jgi:phosphopantetheinyl transferase (holo-ACP synthase)